MFHFHRKRDMLSEAIWVALSVIVIVSTVIVLLRNEPLPPPVAVVLVALLIVGAVDGLRVRAWTRIKADHPMPPVTEVMMLSGGGKAPVMQVTGRPLDPKREAALQAMLKALADSMAESEATEDEEDKPSSAAE